MTHRGEAGGSGSTDAESGIGPEWTSVRGTVVPGYGVASGRSDDSPYPAGTIALQRPFFAALGLDLGDLHPATVNVDIAPATYALRRPRHTFSDVRWTQLHDPETFSFLDCVLHREREARGRRGWIYHPHPETKPMHTQPSTILEVLMPYLPALFYGEVVTLHLLPRQIDVRRSGRRRRGEDSVQRDRDAPSETVS